MFFLLKPGAALHVSLGFPGTHNFLAHEPIHSDVMRFIFSVWLVAALDLILASPTLQDVQPRSDVSVFSSEGSDPLNIGSIDIASNLNLGASDTSTESNDFALNPNGLELGSTIVDWNEYLTESENKPDEFYSLENPSDSPTLQASCGTEILRARDDAPASCGIKQEPSIQLPLDLFPDVEGTYRRLPQKEPDTEKGPSSPSTPPASSGDSNKCIPEFPIRCCTDSLGEYSPSFSRQLYFIKPAQCIQGTWILPSY